MHVCSEIVYSVVCSGCVYTVKHIYGSHKDVTFILLRSYFNPLLILVLNTTLYYRSAEESRSGRSFSDIVHFSSKSGPSMAEG